MFSALLKARSVLAAPDPAYSHAARQGESGANIQEQRREFQLLLLSCHPTLRLVESRSNKNGRIEEAYGYGSVRESRCFNRKHPAAGHKHSARSPFGFTIWEARDQPPLLVETWTRPQRTEICLGYFCSCHFCSFLPA